MSKKGHQFFFRKKIGVTPSVAAPGVTHPSDATEGSYERYHLMIININAVYATRMKLLKHKNI